MLASHPWPKSTIDFTSVCSTGSVATPSTMLRSSLSTSGTALRAATLGGARALGFDHLVGSIEPGKQADLACIDLAQVETQPLHHVVSQLVYATGRQQVTDVWIAGKPKLRERALVDMDAAALVANARQWQARIAAISI